MYQKGNQLKICKFLWNASDYTKILYKSQKIDIYMSYSKNKTKNRCHLLASSQKDTNYTANPRKLLGTTTTLPSNSQHKSQYSLTV